MTYNLWGVEIYSCKKIRNFPFLSFHWEKSITFEHCKKYSFRPFSRPQSVTEQSSPGHLIFFLLPIGIQISVNCVLFVLTAIHCNRIKAEIHRMQACDNSEQQKKKSFIADKAMWVKISLLNLLNYSNDDDDDTCFVYNQCDFIDYINIWMHCNE